MTLKQFKAAIKVGMAIEVLDHWLPKYIGTMRHVTKVQGNGFFFTMGGSPERCWSPFPRASELRFVDGVAHVLCKESPRRGPRFWVFRLDPPPPTEGVDVGRKRA